MTTQLDSIQTQSFIIGSCRIMRGDTDWSVRHNGQHVGNRDTFDEADTLAQRETARLDRYRSTSDASHGARCMEQRVELVEAARDLGLSVSGIDQYGNPEIC